METFEEQGGESMPQADDPTNQLASKELSRETTLPSRETVPLSKETVPISKGTTPPPSRETALPSRETVDDQALDTSEAITQHGDCKASTDAMPNECRPSKEQGSDPQEGLEQNGRKPGEEKHKNMIPV
ncbi:hypothetical protein OSTOST_05605 [Ostertagia ostertagi]